MRNCYTLSQSEVNYWLIIANILFNPINLYNTIKQNIAIANNTAIVDKLSWNTFIYTLENDQINAVLNFASLFNVLILSSINSTSLLV